MKRKSGQIGSGGLDMLLDTMCNTFGGVCFIALLVAILSAMLPKDSGDAGESVGKLVEDAKLAEAVRTRDELAVALETQRELLSRYGTNGLSTVTAADIAKSMKDKDAAAKELSARRSELEERIKRLATADKFNRQEYERLKKVQEGLKRQIANFKDVRKRVVRAPIEREDARYKPVDFWIRGGRFRILEDKSQVVCREEGFGDRKKWFYTCRSGTGWPISEAFLASADYARAIRSVPSKTKYARIWVDHDPKSFAGLCLFRDDLIRRGISYNWHPNDDETMVFVVGLDTHVQ